MANGKRDNQSSGRLFGGVWTALGILLGILSISSLIQRWGDITMAELTGEVLAYYRVFMDQAKWLFFDWWPPLLGWGIWMPQWGMDWVTVYILSLAAIERDQPIAAALRGIGPIEDLDRPDAPDRYPLTLREIRDLFLRIFVAPVVLVYEIYQYARATVVWARGIVHTYVKTRFDITLPWHESYSWTRFPEDMIDSFVWSLRSLFLLLSPFLGAIAFFIWNAIQLSA